MKRELAGIRERIESAIEQLLRLAIDVQNVNPSTVAEAMREIVACDLAEAKRLIEYVESTS